MILLESHLVTLVEMASDYHSKRKARPQTAVKTIKMDIEGGESELLPIMIPYLKENRPSLWLSTHWSFIPEHRRCDLLEAMARLTEIYPAEKPHDLESVKVGFPSFLFTTDGC